MREAGDVCYADVYRDGSGVVEFTTREDMKNAIKHLDDTKFRSHEVKRLPFEIVSSSTRRQFKNDSFIHFLRRVN